MTPGWWVEPAATLPTQHEAGTEFGIRDHRSELKRETPKKTVRLKHDGRFRGLSSVPHDRLQPRKSQPPISFTIDPVGLLDDLILLPLVTHLDTTPRSHPMQSVTRGRKLGTTGLPMQAQQLAPVCSLG
jgi:hypothetical protein